MKNINKHKIKINNGNISFIYNDGIAGLLELGNADIFRASHVEPEHTHNGIKWFADLYPIDGPKLGPFNNRYDALEAESQWILNNYL